MAADHARKTDPNSALCTLAAVLVTRIACWRNGQRYELRDLNGNSITDEQGRALCANLKPPTRTASARTGTGRRSTESQSAPATGPSANKST